MEPIPWRFLVLTEADGASGPAVQNAEDWLASVDAARFEPAALAQKLGSAAGLDPALHDPALQRLESAWRGVRFLLDQAGGSVDVQVLPVGRKDLVARFRETIFEPAMDGRSPVPWSLVLADYDFSHRNEDLAILYEWGGMLASLQTPMVAAVSPGFFDMRYTSQVMRLPDMAGRIMDPALAAWRSFQASTEARWIAFTFNRFLLRAPYDLEDLGYRESADDAHPESFLWGRGLWLVGAAAARSVRTHGHALDLAGRGGLFENLPVRPYPVAANEKVSLATEVPIPDEKAQEISRAAFTPLVGALRRAAAVLPTVVTLFRLRPGRPTVEATLAYQLMAGRLAQVCTALLEEIPAGGEAETARAIEKELLGFLGPLAGEATKEAVSVQVVHEEADGVARAYADVRVRPVVTLEGKVVDFELRLPVRTV